MLAGVATLAAGLVAGWAIAPRVPGGDEPHYLVITQSLLRDHDLRIANNHADPDYVAAFGVLKPDKIRNGRNGEVYSIHAPGLPVLVLPAFALFGIEAPRPRCCCWPGSPVRSSGASPGG